MIEDILKVVILSLIEGVTEFLPISSTGHLIVGTSLLNFDVMGSVFEISIQFGAVIAVTVYYRRILCTHIVELRSSQLVRRFWSLVALGCFPAAAIGFILGEQLEALLFSPQVVAMSLIVGGAVFLLIERRLPPLQLEDGNQGSITDITASQAVTVGVVQMLALIPGASRSGSSIIGGMLSGLNRRVATEFSFFLAMPLLGGATLYKFALVLDSLDPSDLFLLFLGAALSAVFAWFSIDWLLKFVARNTFVAFGYYRIIAGLLIIAALSAGWIA